jgi:hypothetical protein
VSGCEDRCLARLVLPPLDEDLNEDEGDDWSEDEELYHCVLLWELGGGKGKSEGSLSNSSTSHSL